MSAMRGLIGRAAIDKLREQDRANAPISDLVKLTEIKRELAMRRKVYPRSVSSMTMKKSDADHQIRVMEAIEADYAARVEAEQAKERLL
jgi:hypothetical protein